MQFQKVFYRYNTTPDANAIIVLGADSAPTTAYGTNGVPPAAAVAPGKVTAANVDNVLSCRRGDNSYSAEVKRIAVAMVGPTGAASQTANMYVWDGGTQHWYLVNATALTLVNNQVVFFDAVSLAELPIQQQKQGLPQPTQGGSDYMLVVSATTPTAGQYLFAMSAQLNQGSSGL